MRFHLKMTLCMLALLSVLFGIGGSLLISESFQESLEREKEAALGDYRMAWGTLQIVNSMDPYLDRDGVVKTMEQLYQQNSASWSDLRLSAGDEVLYEGGERQTPLSPAGPAIEVPEPGACLFRILTNESGAHFLVFSGAVETGGEVLRLAASHDVSALYAEQGIALSWECEPGVCLLEADLVWTLLLNLADNARKAIERSGEIQFQQEMLADGCRVRVLDSGRGIPPQALEHLTEAFYRVDKARSRAQGGFGLGLSLCREIAALHHGDIRFENRPEGGACVTVELRGGRKL